MRMYICTSAKNGPIWQERAGWPLVTARTSAQLPTYAIKWSQNP